MLLQLMWITFGLVWDLRRLGAIDAVQEDVLYLSCDFMAKVWTHMRLHKGACHKPSARLTLPLVFAETSQVACGTLLLPIGHCQGDVRSNLWQL